MIQVREKDKRGHFDFGWLKTYHTFSFGDYYDPNFVGFRTLRVINEDFVAAGQGFGTHPHRDMEIITYLMEGEIQHRDSMGTGSVIRTGEIQYMSAGTGVTHSEFNPSDKKATHLYQIWILPNQKGLKPRYDQKKIEENEKKEKWKLLVSPSGENDSIQIQQDAKLFATHLNEKSKIEYPLSPNRHAWLQMTHGKVKLGNHDLSAGDGAAISDEKKVHITALENSELLLFDLS